MFARDYRIEVAADTRDNVYWKMTRKGEHVSPTYEDKEMLSMMLRKVLTMIDKSLEEYRQRKRDKNMPEYKILRELQVTTEHFNEFQQMMKDGELECMTFKPYDHPTIRLWLRGGQMCVETGGWLMTRLNTTIEAQAAEIRELKDQIKRMEHNEMMRKEFQPEEKKPWWHRLMAWLD